MAFKKILWVVNYNDVRAFLASALDVGATAVAIRTDNDVARAIPLFHAKALEVYGWRWPSANEDAALKEAAKVIALLNAGLDGYFVDPEGAKKGPGGKPLKPYDWDQSGLEGLAREFCDRIRSAAPDKEFGTTSHYRAAATFPRLPWSEFFAYSTVLLPQAYWRSTEGVIGHGIPGDNYRRSIDFWVAAGGEEAKIVPMAGELGSVTGAEIKAHAKAAAAKQIETLHFYCHEPSISKGVWNAVRSLA